MKIKFLAMRKAGQCNACGARYGSKSRPRILRFAVPDEHRGIVGLSICKKCLVGWLEKFGRKARPQTIVGRG